MRSLSLRGLHLAALWTITFVQPLFDILGKNAAFFVARGNTPGDVLIFAFAWALGPPLIATALVGLAGAVSERLGRALHLALVAALCAVLALQVIKGVSSHAGVVLPIAAILGVAAAAAYARFAPLRSFVSILGVAPVVVLALLLLFSPVHDVVFPGDDAVAAGSRVGKPVPVVVLVFDELPTPTLMKPDHSIDAERFPNFARLARSSTWYRNATSVSDGTYVAVPAIFTGKRPEAELPTSREYPENLFTLLGRTYEQHVQEPITSVCPDSLCGARERDPQGERLKALAQDLGIVERRLLLPEGMAAKLPPIDRDWEDFQAEAGNDDLAESAAETAASPTDEIRVAGDDLPAQRVIAGLNVVRTMKPGGPRPGLWLVHYVIPHVPWRFLPDGSQYVVQGPTMPGLNDQTWGDDPFLLDQAFQRHLLMSRFADTLLGDALDQLQRSGLWEKALVIVVADHGGAIGPGESRRPVTKQNFPQVASVPFFVKAPGQARPAVEDTFVTTLDVVPTVAKALAVDTDFDFDGIPVDEPHPAELLQMRNGRLARLVGVTPRDFVRRRDQELAERLRRWPPGLDSIWRIGPRQELVGRPLTSLAEGADTEAGAFLNSASLYRRVEPDSGVIPAYVTGSWRALDAGTDLAVAVNGTIAATGEAYLEHSEPRFSMMIPPEILEAGRNSVQIVALDGDAYEVLDEA